MNLAVETDHMPNINQTGDASAGKANPLTGLVRRKCQACANLRPELLLRVNISRAAVGVPGLASFGTGENGKEGMRHQPFFPSPGHEHQQLHLRPAQQATRLGTERSSFGSSEDHCNRPQQYPGFKKMKKEKYFCQSVSTLGNLRLDTNCVSRQSLSLPPPHSTLPSFCIAHIPSKPPRHQSKASQRFARLTLSKLQLRESARALGPQKPDLLELRGEEKYGREKVLARLLVFPVLFLSPPTSEPREGFF
ncbi:uncharacterized protein LOC131186015 [Ahaetulla prasina]|uniref:uncharacterized protein LOC131186015 n=1 Tax=Ahaetulla prasina TaxID=499056 RepID=UPI0026482755|nr:uncharacterized protein LOC131186015 [Ahaetulla prasina]